MQEYHRFSPEHHTTKADRTNELPEKEVEVEFEIDKDADPDQLAKVIFNEFSDLKTENSTFVIAKSLPNIAESLTKQIRFFTGKGDDKVRLFTVVIRERDGAILLKKKSPKINSGDIKTRDEVEYQLPYENWSKKVEEEIVESQAKDLDIPVEAINKKEIDKRKLKIRVENSDTNRVYTIGINTKTNKKGKQKIQLNIEYVGREVDSDDIESNAENLILNDLDVLKERVSTLI